MSVVLPAPTGTMTRIGREGQSSAAAPAAASPMRTVARIRRRVMEASVRFDRPMLGQARTRVQYRIRLPGYADPAWRTPWSFGT